MQTKVRQNMLQGPVDVLPDSPAAKLARIPSRSQSVEQDVWQAPSGRRTQPRERSQLSAAAGEAEPRTGAGDTPVKLCQKTDVHRRAIRTPRSEERRVGKE